MSTGPVSQISRTSENSPYLWRNPVTFLRLSLETRMLPVSRAVRSRELPTLSENFVFSLNPSDKHVDSILTQINNNRLHIPSV